MKKIFILIILILITFGITRIINKKQESLPRNDLQMDLAYYNAPLEDGKYVVETDTSLVNWKGSSVILSERGTLGISHGSLSVVNGHITGSIVFDMNSILSETGKDLNTHLKNKDFFETNRYPNAIFVIKEYQNGYLNGELKIKDVTQEVIFPVTIQNSKEEKLVLSAEAVEIDRALWNITFNSHSFFNNLGNKAISDIIELDVTISIKKNDS